MRGLLTFAGFSGFVAVAMGAVGRHALPDDARVQAAVATAVMIHLGHTVALLALAAVARQAGWPWAARSAAALMMLGIVLFPGAVYTGALFGMLGFLAPIGGVALMLAWVAVAAFGLGLARGDESPRAGSGGS